MSVNITVKNAVKRYGPNTILSNLSVNIKEGEFFTLLGPSGCGKTTLLRMIAGFNSIEGGEFYFNDTMINNMPPAKRNIGMVFQNYAIFPHLSVFKNVAFGLKQRKLTKAKITEKVNNILRTMQIEEYRDRMPERLSGGQQQRVALARAVVIEPDVLLMDEPLSNLDAKLRVEMRTAIKEIQQKVNITTVYVTHDQEEAMAVSDRIAVMNHGDIQHIGTPQNIYQRPANLFVATFIGRSNILDGKLVVQGDKVVVTLQEGTSFEMNKTDFTDKVRVGNVKVSIRPEEFMISKENRTNQIKGKVRTTVFLGLNTHYNIELANGEFVDIVEESSIDRLYQEGEEVALDIKLDKINIFDQEGSINYVQGVKNEAIY